MQLRLALPKGQLLQATSVLLHESGLAISGYDELSRSYRPKCGSMPDLFMKVFNEKDIPIQVAVGNYDLGICGQDWVEELLAKYPSSALIKVQNLGYCTRDLSIAVSKRAEVRSLDSLRGRTETIRIATEYPNLAEAFALRQRFKRFAIFPLWGAAEVYPPENADVVLIPQVPDKPMNPDLVPLITVLRAHAYLIAHRPSWESKDMSPLLDRICACTAKTQPFIDGERSPDIPQEPPPPHKLPDTPRGSSVIRLALPDGHQQKPALEFLARAGVTITDNPEHPRRPAINLDGVNVKVIRPQDMPLQVANRNFDLAITGEDWLFDHLYRFPSSPVKKILTLGFGKVRIVAVVSRQTPFQSLQDFSAPLRRQAVTPIRIASEYINIADKYARDNHLSPCRLIPTWGATEAFLPEDADLLIENTQTGRTLEQHNLRIIDTLFESAACLIGNTQVDDDNKKKRIAEIVQLLEQTLKEVQ